MLIFSLEAAPVLSNYVTRSLVKLNMNYHSADPTWPGDEVNRVHSLSQDNIPINLPADEGGGGGCCFDMDCV